MPVCRNRSARARPDPEVNALQAYMTRRPSATFDEIRANVPELVTHTDAELRQTIQDAGFEHHDD